MSARILIMEVDSEGDAVKILRSVATMAEAGDAARAIEATEGALATLTGPELVRLHNAMIGEGLPGTVERFADKKAGARRVLDMWMAEDIIQQPASPPGTASVAVPAKKAKAKTKRAGKVKKTPGAGRPKKALNGTIHIVPAKCEGKTWQQKSARYAAFQVIQANNGLTITDYVAKVGAGALGFLGKLVEVGVVELKGV